MPKIKITYAGQPCRECGNPVEKRIPKRKKLKPGQNYYFDYYFFCKKCKTMYMVEAVKHYTT